MPFNPRMPVRVTWRTTEAMCVVTAQTMHSYSAVFEAVKNAPDTIEVNAYDADDMGFRGAIGPAFPLQ